jgi:hypothetical protein
MDKTKYKTTAWAIGLLGLWLMVAGSLIKAANWNLCDNLFVGAMVAFLGMSLGKVKTWQGWSSYVFGVWIVITAFIPRFLVGSGHLWNNAIVGVLIAIAGFTALDSELSTFRIPKG